MSCSVRVCLVVNNHWTGLENFSNPAWFHSWFLHRHPSALQTTNLQSQYNIVPRLSQGCYMVVTRGCQRVVTRLSQGCNKVVTVLLKGCHS